MSRPFDFARKHYMVVTAIRKRAVSCFCAGNRYPRNDLERMHRENQFMFQTIIDGTVKAPIQFSMDDGFLGIRKQSTPPLKRARSGSSVPDNANSTMMMTLREASRHMHERKRTSVSTRQEQHSVDIHELREPDGFSVDKNPRSLTLSSKSTHSPSSSHKERPMMLSAPRRFVVGTSRQQCCLLLGIFRRASPFRCCCRSRRTHSSTFLLINQMNQAPLPTIDETKPMRDAGRNGRRTPSFVRCLLCCNSHSASRAATADG